MCEILESEGEKNGNSRGVFNRASTPKMYVVEILALYSRVVKY